MVALATAVGQVLAREGVRQAFGVVGGGNILAVAGLTGAGVRYISARHEGGAMAMADAYHRVTGEVAVCTTSHGAGLTNAVTGLAEAVKHGSGVLVVCGDGPVAGPRRADIDQLGLATAVGATVVRVTDPATALDTATGALRFARANQCPVVLGLAADLLSYALPVVRPGATPPAAGRRPAADGPLPPGDALPLGDASLPAADGPLPLAPADLDAVLDVLASARFPLLLAGNGAWRSGAAQPIQDLADRLGGLLTTTVMASGLFHGNPWSLGLFGGFASPGGVKLIGMADAIVAFGASLDPFTLHHGMLVNPSATVVQIDVTDTPTAARVDLGVTADASQAAAALLAGAVARDLPRSAWRPQVADEIRQVGEAHEHFDDASTADLIDPRTLTVELGRRLPAERTLVLDGGHFIAWPSMYWQVADPSSFAFMGAAFQAIGLGFAGAVGAATGTPDRTTVVVLGDGGALMGLPELETLVRSGLPALVVIYDDASYGFEVHMYGPAGADLATARFQRTDFAGIARSLGATAATVRRVADLAAVSRWDARGRPGTLVLDCKVVPDVVARFLSDLVALHSRT